MPKEGNTISFAKISDILAERGITKKKFANDIGVSNITLQRWVSGVMCPNYEHLKNICEKLGVTASDILGF